MSKKFNENLDLGSVAKIINVPAPSSAGDAANKAYVDAAVVGVTYVEAPVRVAVTTNVNTASPGASLDGLALAAGNRVLLAAQTTPSQNGTWLWNGAAVAMTRTADAFQNGTVVISGSDGSSTNRDSQWMQTTDGPITVGTTAMTWVQLPNVQISAGTGLTQTGAVISLTAPVTIALGGTGATTAAAALAGLGAARGTEFDIGDGAASSFTLNTAKSMMKYPSVQVVNNSTGQIEDALVTITPGAPTGGVYTPSVVVTSEAWVAVPPTAVAYHVTIVG